LRSGLLQKPAGLAIGVEMITVRPSFKQELEQFVAFEAEEDTKEYIMPYSHVQHAECYEDDTMCHLSIMEDEKVIGFFLLSLENDTVEFRRVVVTRAARGVGQQAIEKMHSFCAHTLGAHTIWLDVFEYNQRARHIYSKMGYKVVGSQPYGNRRLLIMEKHIRQDAAPDAPGPARP
jgi:RimJ/RimL family protein N-acetyltransferase